MLGTVNMGGETGDNVYRLPHVQVTIGELQNIDTTALAIYKRCD